MENIDNIIETEPVVIQEPSKTCSKCNEKKSKEKKTCSKCNKTRQIFWKTAAIGLTTIALSIYGLVHLIRNLIESLT